MKKFALALFAITAWAETGVTRKGTGQVSKGIPPAEQAYGAGDAIRPVRVNGDEFVEYRWGNEIFLVKLRKPIVDPDLPPTIEEQKIYCRREKQDKYKAAHLRAETKLSEKWKAFVETLRAQCVGSAITDPIGSLRAFRVGVGWEDEETGGSKSLWHIPVSPAHETGFSMTW